MEVRMTLSTPSSGHAPGLPSVTRRSLLQASPALLAPSLLAGPALAEAGTPILRLFREWDEFQAFWNDTGNSFTDQESDAMYRRLCALEERIEAEPVTCLADLAAKIIVSTVYGDFGPDKWLMDDCEAILAGGAA
jgi:hypothetical protein